MRNHNIVTPTRFSAIFYNKWLMAAIAAFICLFIMFAMQVTVQAAPQHAYGRDPGRIQPININDRHTNQWDRFHWNYQFRSGMDYRFDLGRATTFNGFVPPNVYWINFRSDAQVSLRPPGFGVFSGNFATDPSNRFFPQPVNPNFHQPNMWGDPNLNPSFDTLNLGANAPQGNQHSHSNVSGPSNSGGSGFLPPTSIR